MKTKFNSLSDIVAMIRCGSLVPRLSTHISPWKAWDIITRECRRGRREGRHDLIGRRRRALD